MFHAAKRVDSLLAQPISRAAARQRAGRAGRQAPGKCFRLFPESVFFEELAEAAQPELLRRSLGGVILSLKALGVQDALAFDFITPPPRASLLAALEELLALGALDSRGELTPDGRLMATLPLDPTYAKAVLCARDTPSCFDHMLALVSALCADGPLFHSPAAHRDAADEARRRFASAPGDTITAVNVFVACDARGAGGRQGGAGGAADGGAGASGGRQRRGVRKWCEAHFVNWRTLEAAYQARSQHDLGAISAPLRSHLAHWLGRLTHPPPPAEQVAGQLHGACARLGLRPASPGASANSSAELPALSPLSADASIELRRRLAAAFFLQARDEPELRARATVAHPPLPTPSQSAIRQPSGDYLALTSKQLVGIHPSSVLFQVTEPHHT